MTPPTTTTWIDIEERGSLELTDESHVRAMLSIGPELQDRQYFTLGAKGGKYFVTAGRYIGVIPVGHELTLRVRPKVSIPRLVEILERADEEPHVLHDLARDYEPAVDWDVSELLILALHRSLAPLFHHGLIREYMRVSESGATPRGRLLLAETSTTMWPRAAFDRVAYEYFAFSPENPLNQALEHTLWHVQRIIQQIPHRIESETLTVMKDAHRMFALVTPDRTRAFLPALRRHLDHRVTSEPYLSFRPLLSICRMILDNLGVDLAAEASDPVVLPPLVIDMEAVFERFVLNELQANAHGGLSVWDTNSEHQVPRMRTPSIPVPTGVPLVVSGAPAEPDFTIALDKQPVLVGDVKYKSNSRVADIYQVVAHAAAYGAKDVLLVYPATDDAARIKFECIGSLGEVRVFTARYPLDTLSLDAASKELFDGACLLISSQDQRQHAQINSNR